jgi:hypothetical protein
VRLEVDVTSHSTLAQPSRLSGQPRPFRSCSQP